MKTFAELLTDYMARTGTSDSELARTLGVRRQTIFRWKEGLVERPRHREDVLLCAKKLRLTPAERDELLLAAGFAPENPETVLPAPIAEPVQPTLITLVESLQSTATDIVPTRAPRRISKIAWLAVTLVVMSLIVGLVAIFYLRSDANFPSALPGEQLVVIAQFDAITQPKPSPDAPSRKLSGENPGTSSDDFPSRLQVALEREVRAARIDNVRVITWSVPIRDANAAEAFRQRANASIVIWGNARNDKVTVALAVAPLASRADDLPLDTLIDSPSNTPLTIGSSPDEIQSLALLTVSELYLVDGDAMLARASLTQALARPPTDQASMAMLNLRLSYAMQISKPPELGDAIQFYSQTIALAPDHPTAYLNQGVAYIRLNDAAGWQTDFARVLALQSNHLGAQLAQCWAYALDQKPDPALPHCDAAISRDATARSREARAIVYAELGRLPDAAADLQIFVDWLARQPPGLRARYGTSRADWLQSMKAGKNPIDATVLGKLRQE